MIAVVLDGELVAPEAASISVFDRGLLYGDGLFEVLRTWGGVAIDLPAHLARLAASARALALRVPDDAAITAAVARAIAAAGAGEHRLRIVVTRGPGALGARLATLAGGRTIVIAEPLPPVPAALTAIAIAAPSRRAGPHHKTLAYLDHVLARELAAAAGADEAIGVDADGGVVEGATSNVFAVVDGTVVTPPLAAGALPGIVRARVLALCARDRIAAAAERALPIDTLHAASEIFVTSSLRGVVAVIAVDGRAFIAGPVTAALAHAYRDDCLRRARSAG